MTAVEKRCPAKRHGRCQLPAGHEGDHRRETRIVDHVATWNAKAEKSPTSVGAGVGGCSPRAGAAYANWPRFELVDALDRLRLANEAFIAVPEGDDFSAEVAEYDAAVDDVLRVHEDQIAEYIAEQADAKEARTCPTCSALEGKKHDRWCSSGIVAFHPDGRVVSKFDAAHVEEAAGAPPDAATDADAEPPDLTAIGAGDIVVIRWLPYGTKHAIFRRWNRAGNPVLGVERVDRKGTPLGEFGSDRVFTRDDILGVEPR